MINNIVHKNLKSVTANFQISKRLHKQLLLDAKECGLNKNDAYNAAIIFGIFTDGYYHALKTHSNSTYYNTSKHLQNK